MMEDDDIIGMEVYFPDLIHKIISREDDLDDYNFQFLSFDQSHVIPDEIEY